MAWSHGTQYGYKHHGCRCAPCVAAKRAKENVARDEAGVIATLVDVDSGATTSFHVPGLARDAIRVAAARCDAMGATWKVRSLSTPRTVLRDLRDARGSLRSNGFAAQVTPEPTLLGQVGRHDLLAPELVAGGSDYA